MNEERRNTLILAILIGGFVFFMSKDIYLSLSMFAFVIFVIWLARKLKIPGSMRKPRKEDWKRMWNTVSIPNIF